MPSTIVQMSLSDIASKIENKLLSPVEIVNAAIKEIEKRDSSINSFITVMAEQAFEKAKQAENEIIHGHYKGPLHGIPIALKDNIFTKGIRTTSGSEIYKEFIPSEDAEIVYKLESNGAIILGKLNMHQFAHGTTGDVSFFGPTRNPHDLTKIAGGSSSGSGAAVAANFVYGSIGTDTGGSIRIPASCCGVVGMKPTFGLVSKHGTFPLAQSLDHLGPMTRTVKDNAYLLNSIVGYDSKDPFSIKGRTSEYTEHIGKSLHGLTIGIPQNFYFDIIDNGVRLSFEQTVRDLIDCGVDIKYIDITGLESLLKAQKIILFAESSAALEQDFKLNPDLIEEEITTKIVSGMSLSATEYVQMLRVKQTAKETFLKVFKEIDVIMSPTLVCPPGEIGSRRIDVQGKEFKPNLLARLTGLMNTLGFPAMSVPGIPTDNLPMGIQFCGPPLSESKLYQFAYAVEKLYG